MKETLRKAAGLLVEMPPEEYHAASSSPPGAPLVSSPADDEMAEIDRRLAAGRQVSPGLRPTGSPPSTKTVEEITREHAGPALGEVAVPPDSPAPSSAAGGKLDFKPIYDHANLPATPFTAEQTLDMLESLPKELPMEMKRQTVKVTLTAMGKSLGATPETIVADASRKLAALSSFVDQLTQQTTDFTASATAEMAALQAQIEEKRKAIDSAQARNARAVDACRKEADRLDDVLEFFSLDVPPSKHAPETATEPGS